VHVGVYTFDRGRQVVLEIRVLVAKKRNEGQQQNVRSSNIVRRPKNSNVIYVNIRYTSYMSRFARSRCRLFTPHNNIVYAIPMFGQYMTKNESKLTELNIEQEPMAKLLRC